jgi:exosome complex component RRP4
MHENAYPTLLPASSSYVGEIGDVVVGRILEVSGRRWVVDTQSRLNSVLKLSSVNLPGGVLVRRQLSWGMLTSRAMMADMTCSDVRARQTSS